MPKKTKEEKIVARYRQRLKLLEQQTSSPFTETVVTKTIKEPTQSTNKTFNFTEKDASLKKFFFKDLTKSLLLIVLIVALEIGLYFVRIK